jgi:uncharacterized membrane protein YdfJ with MMPL/SSD domain
MANAAHLPGRTSLYGRGLVEVVLAADPESPEAVRAVRGLRAELGSVEGANALVGGVSATDLDTLETAQRDFAVVVPLVLVVVFLVLIPLLRSLVDALLVRTLLIPALSLDTGPRLWWPGRAARTADGSGSDVTALSPGAAAATSQDTGPGQGTGAVRDASSARVSGPDRDGGGTATATRPEAPGRPG